MHAAQRALLRRQRIVDLHKFRDEPGLRELVLAEYAGKEPAIVAALFDLDRIGALQRGRMKLHVRLFRRQR